MPQTMPQTMPQPMHAIRRDDTAAPAPGDLELVQRFMNLHEHLPGVEADQPPSREMLEGFLRDRGLLREKERFTGSDQATALELRRALHAKVRANRGGRIPRGDVGAIDRLARRAGLRPHFGPDGPVLVPEERGVTGALGHLVAIVFLAELGGSWADLKECAGDGCTAVFYDRSKNHSGRWCSMSTCGNRAKVRAWRERRRVDAGG